MKKILITMASILFISTSISFAYAPNPNVEKFVSDLDLIKNELTILTKTVMGLEGKSSEEINEIRKNIAGATSNINYSIARVNSLYRNETDPAVRKQYSAISNTLSSFSFALDSFLLYLANPDDINQLIDAVYEIRTGTNSLNDVRQSLTRSK